MSANEHADFQRFDTRQVSFVQSVAKMGPCVLVSADLQLPYGFEKAIEIVMLGLAKSREVRFSECGKAPIPSYREARLSSSGLPLIPT